jgi:glutamate-1-semialdehyde aminotransferase
MPLEAGVAVTDITPPAGVELSGGAFGAAKGVLHPLSAKAMALDDGRQRLLLISCDLLGFDAADATRIRRRIAREHGVAFEGILLAATHTHCAPATVKLRNWGTPDEDYNRRLEEQLVQVAGEALGSMRPARVGSAAGDGPGVAVNRRRAGGRTNPRMTVLRMDTAEGVPLAAAVNFACHPVNLHSSGMITPDFPWYLERDLRARLGVELPVLYLTGACGDLNPANFDFQPSESAAEQTAAGIAAVAGELLSAAETTDEAELAYAAGDVKLPLAPLPEADELRSYREEHRRALDSPDADALDAWKLAAHKTAVEWADEALAAVEAGRVEKTHTLPLTALRIGDAGLVGVGGELFAEFGEQVARCDALPHTFVVALAGGCAGYFPSRDAYERESYEAVACPRYIGLYTYAPGCGERVGAACVEMLHRLPHLSRNAASREWWSRGCNLIVGGGQAHKRPVKYLCRGGPAFATRAEGARFWDADGNEYIDYLLAYGPIVLGHADEQVAAAVRGQMDRGHLFSVEHPLAVELAEELTGLIPSAEMVRYFVGGSSAVLGAVRCARAFTGRQKIIRCGYHGWFDWCRPTDPGAALLQREVSFEVPYGDLSSLRERLEGCAGDAAAVVIEAVQQDGPPEGYFDGVRRLCDEHGAVFVLDEIKTGFRFHLGGAQALLGIEPDLSAFGKAMCNGYPGSALVGRRRVLEGREDTFLAATFHADLLSLAAARTVIRVLRERSGIEHFHALGRRLIDGCNEVFRDAALPCRVIGLPPMPTPVETGADDAETPMTPAYKGRSLTEFCAACQRRGVYVTGHPWFLSLAHTAEDIEHTLSVATDAAREARELIERLPYE